MGAGRLTLWWSVLVVVCGTTLGQSECGENEVFKQCGNNCLNTCFPRYIPHECPDVCNPGCMCDEGWLRHFKSKKCIPRERCLKEQKCELFEEYTSCGSKCREKCGSSDCPSDCEEGCFCKSGFSRNNGGRCVPSLSCRSSEMKPECGPLEEYSDCGNRCKEKCPPMTDGCVAVCEKGCFCKDGHVRNKDGKCVPNNTCRSTGNGSNSTQEEEEVQCKRKGPNRGRRCNTPPSKRWWFNCRKSRCERFRFRGCGGDNNNYKSRAACVEARITNKK